MSHASKHVRAPLVTHPSQTPVADTPTTTVAPMDHDLMGRPKGGHHDTVRILLVGHSPMEEDVLRSLASRFDAPRFEWAQVEAMQNAMTSLATRTPDVVLIKLSEDGEEADSIQELVNRYPDMSVVTIAPPRRESMGLSSIQVGAQDYMVAGNTDAMRMRQMIRATVERNRLWSALRETALIDELTGLYNRRGFLALARQQLRLAERAGMEATLLFVDVDNMKRINDTLGHRYGDMALTETADNLRDAFRDADLVGRIGGDEFVVLALHSVDSPVHAAIVRLEDQLEDRRPGAGPFALQLSIGLAEFTPDAPSPIEALLALADTAMYKRKQASRAPETTRSGPVNEPAVNDLIVRVA